VVAAGLFWPVRLESSVPPLAEFTGGAGALIPRYTRPEMGRIWSDENRFRTWLAVEVAATETLAEAGMVPKEAAHAIRERADFSVERIHEIEAEVRHDVIAFTTAVAEIVGPHARWFHYGLTSNDVVDTAQALLIKQASELIAKDLQGLTKVLERRAWEFKDTPMVGRTHGIHAEPITFGFKIANWYSETQRNIARFKAAAEDMRVGKFSGAVGIFAHLTPEIEEKICARLGLRAAAVSSQVIQRDRHAHYLATLAVIASTLDKIATEIRHLQRTEVREAEEFFSEKQKGSSAMPHKRNPVTSEQISGLARVVRSNAQAGFENVVLWHERDISHSSAERVILPDSTTLIDYLLNKTSNLVDTMFVYPERMKANLESTHGLIFSGQLLLDLVEHGVSREDAYRIVQSHAMRAWKEGLDFHQLVVADKEITAKVPRKQIEYAFDLPRQLKNVDKIFARVFGDRSKKSQTHKRSSGRKKSHSSTGVPSVRRSKMR
jgi:adenylosuccinate lyase